MELVDLIQCYYFDFKLVVMFGFVVDLGYVEWFCCEFDVDMLYYVVVYKYVFIVEENFVVGVCNNILGMLVVVQGVEVVGVSYFILVFIDKVVCFINVMGVIKCFFELVLQVMVGWGSSMVFFMVCFGNVLGFFGLVVLLFCEQICCGGLVMVMYFDVICYFMIIFEVVQLVIQVGVMVKGGEVFVLDMGELVWIFDLVQIMICLMGLLVCDEFNLDGDIEIVFSGLWFGEKFFEELLIGDVSV